MRSLAMVLVMVAVCAATCLGEDKPVQHRFLAVDNGGNLLIYVDQFHPEKSWSVPIPAGSRDIQVLGADANAKVLVSHGNGAAEYDLATGKKLAWAVDRYKGIQSSIRLADGNTLLCSAEATIYTLDAAGKELSVAKCKEKVNCRLMRLLDNGNLLIGLAHPFAIMEMTRDGDVVRKIETKGKGYKALQLPSGNYLSSAGDESKLVELDKSGKEVSFVGGKKEHPALGLDFISGWDMLPNGNKVLANWLGHGKQGTGVHIVEFTPDNKAVWQWADHKLAKQITNVKILE